MLHVILRRFDRVYPYYTKFRMLNDDDKIIHRFVARVLNKITLYLWFFPTLFSICMLFMNKFEKVSRYYTFEETGGYYIFAEQVTSFILLSKPYGYFSQNCILYFSVCLFLYFTARIYISNVKVYENEAIYSKSIHSVLHSYRDFINDVVELKKDNGFFGDTIRKNCISQAGELKQIYFNFMSQMCNELLSSLNSLINDDCGYICIKVLVRETPDNVLIKETGIFARSPSEKKNRKEGLTNFPINLDIKDKNDTPKNLFEEIIKELNYFMQEKKHTHPIDGLGRIYNDLKAEANYDRTVCNENFRHYKSCMISPIIYDQKLVGFLCYNSSKSWRLRKKHLNLFSGFADKISNLYRTIEYSFGPEDSYLSINGG